jgi:GT2 family glycosyltransferase
MSGGILIDVLMPVFGEWVLAEKAYQSIAPAMEGVGEEYRVHIMDNGTPEWLNQQGQSVSAVQQALGLRQKMRPQDTFHRVEKNLGYPGGVNELAKRGRAPLILIWTSDVVMTPGSIVPLVRAMDDPSVGLVGAKFLFPLDESPHGPAGKVQHAGLEININGEPIHQFIGWSSDNPRVNRRCEVPAVTGALFMTRRNLWEKFGGMDPAYGLGTYEDVDYAFKVRESGSKVLYEPAAWGYHYVGGSIKKGAGRQGFNLPLNATVFRGRWAQRLGWTEWKRW